MRAVWLDVPEEFLEERRRLGLDKKDELWDGVIHMVPPPSYRHSHVSGDLFVAFRAIGRRRGLVAHHESTGLFGPSGAKPSYRIPDVSLFRPDQASERGIEGAELVVEVLSPDDESRDKLPFYAKVGVREVWLVDPNTRVVEILELGPNGYAEVPFRDGLGRSPLLGITLEILDGPRLQLRDGDDVYDV